MRKFLATFVTAILLGPATVGALQAAHPRNSGAHDLKKAHKQQRKALKQRQRAVKKVIGQHEVSSDEGRRFKREMKVERQTLRNEQKSESRRITESRKSARGNHTTVLDSSP